jgi:GT2 family glycosyltransferase
MKASIIIPNWITGLSGNIIKNGDELAWFAENCFLRIKRFTTDYELIVVDNGSTTGVEMMKEHADIYIRNKENIGFGRACNQGFGVATGDYVVCMNNDVFVYKDWLDYFIEQYQLPGDMGVLMPTLIFNDPFQALIFDEVDRGDGLHPDMSLGRSG